jgi:hypothetical protein
MLSCLPCPLCAQDVCGYERDSLDTVIGYDARVIQCLQDYRCAALTPLHFCRIHHLPVVALCICMQSFPTLRT